MPRVLIVDDQKSSTEALTDWLSEQGFEAIDTAGTVKEAQKSIADRSFDLVLLDLELPDGKGLTLLESLEDQPDAEVVVITGHGSTDSAVEAFRGGVIDYLTKPVDLKRLQKIVTKFRRTLELRQEVSTLRDELRRMGRFGRIIGASAAMQRVYDLTSRVAPTSSTVLILGETGTGKELVAETVHQLSRRARKAFIPINCGAVAPNLIESELFGHERGSFTGADRQRKGIFERAHGGTLFLDEITEMPIELQVKLLRVLETGSFNRIGGDQAIEVDVRVIAASNRDVERSVRDGKFREDLLYRLHVFPIRVPPLRERPEDIEILANHFLERLNREAESQKRFRADAVERLRMHHWPGNVRELKNVVERAFIIATGDAIDTEAIPLQGTAPIAAGDSGFKLDIGMSIAEAEKRLILATLDHLSGDKKKAAEVLGISLKTLYNRLNSYGTKAAGSRQDAPAQA